jgi:RNA polymerase sigma-70 factor (ECF subfamily)
MTSPLATTSSPVSRATVASDPLLAGLRARDAASERAFYERHVDRVYRLCARMTGREDLAKECTQDAFVRAFERIDAFRGESALGTWLHAIAVSVVLNTLRRERRVDSRHADLEVVETHHAVVAEADPDLKERLRFAIDALPTGYRTVFLMHDVEGFTHEEIGVALGVAAGTSKTQLFHARRKLREALAPFARTEG